MDKAREFHIITGMTKDQLKDKAIEQMARIAELEKALEPFANAYNELCKLSPDGFGDASNDLRRAAELLEEPTND